MSYYSRINRAFANAPCLPLNEDSKYILFSDCHRGSGTSNDNFLKNQNLYFAALNHYYDSGYHYIELGDGDELWENRCMKQITEIHSDAFWMLSKFLKKERLHMIYGNHDIQKKKQFAKQHECSSYNLTYNYGETPLLPNIKYYSAVILENEQHNLRLHLTHGHQADCLNSTLWKLSRFLVRYIWGPLEHYGFLDPTSAAKNNTTKRKTELRLTHWAKSQQKILIAGHTHRPILPECEYPYYINTGSCVHPRCITGIEIENMHISLIKWSVSAHKDMTLYVKRDVLTGPVSLLPLSKKMK